MAWIKEIHEDKAQDKLKNVYENIRNTRGKVANILKVHSLNVAALKNHLSLYMDAMFQSTSLSREHCELIAVTVSNANGCEYCVAHHSKALNHYWEDKERLEALKTNYHSADLSQKELQMVKYALKITADPTSIQEEDVTALRAVGLTDREIHDLAFIASYFNFVNRIALGLGVKHTPGEVKGYDY